jgi:ATP-dependent Clp protease ATP-binding subunit ClpC
MTAMGISIELTQEAKIFLAEKGYDPTFGARPLRRAVMRYIEDPLAEEILRGTFPQGSTVRAKFDKEKEELYFVDASKDTADAQITEHPEEIAGTN